MTITTLVFAFIRRRPLTWAFHVLTLTTGVAIVLALILVGRSVENRFSRDLAGIDLVVGAKGSPMQIVLSAVFQMDAPTGNITLRQAQDLARNHLVKTAVPVSLGDNIGGARIVGTTPGYGALYGAKLAEGRWWTAPMQVVIGAGAAEQLHLKIGQSFVGSHGLVPGGDVHKHSPYIVTGVLQPTGAVIDRLVLTDLASVWQVHAHVDPDDADEPPPPPEPEVTALLIKYRSAMGALMLPRQVTAQPNLQAASPAVESQRLFSMIGVGADVLQAIGVAILALAAIGFFVALFGAVSQRRRDLALIRALGARPSLLLGVVTLEGGLLGLTGGVLGVLLGRALTAYVAHVSLAASNGPTLVAPPIGMVDAAAVGLAFGLALIASIGPAIVAARTDPARELDGG